MTFVTITGSETQYPTYADIGMANDYMLAVFGPLGTAWCATDYDTLSRALATGYRQLNLLSWTTGYAEDPDWQLAIVSANIEYAAALVEGSFTDQQTQLASGTKRLKADTAEIEYFKVFTRAGPALNLPRTVYDLIKPWLAATSGAAPGYSSGTDGCSAFKYDYRQYF